MFEYFETMADMGIIAKRKSLEEAFKNAAKGLFNLMVDINTIDKKEEREFEVISEDLLGLLYDFLTELLIIHDSEFLIFSDFEVSIKENSTSNKEPKKYILKCTAYGEELNKEKHEPKEEVKAITYHKMEIKQENEEWVIRYIVDL